MDLVLLSIAQFIILKVLYTEHMASGERKGKGKGKGLGGESDGRRGWSSRLDEKSYGL